MHRLLTHSENSPVAPNKETSLVILSTSPAETHRLGCVIGREAQPGDVIALTGELGTGKTVLAKGVADGLGIEPRLVTSPTFVLMSEYQGRLPLYHFDAFRLRDAQEMLDIGCEEIFFGDGVSVLEWADRVPGCLPMSRLEITLRHASEQARQVSILARGSRYENLLENLREAWHE